MQVGRFIKKYIGGFLFPLGFEMQYKNLVWIFKKHVSNSIGENITQYIYVAAYISSDDLSLKLQTNAYGRSSIFYEKNIDGRSVSAFSYRSEDDVINILNMFVDFLHDEGLEKLTEISEPIVLGYPNEEDEELFFKQKEELAKRFIEQQNDAPIDNLAGLADWVCKSIISHKGQPYDEVKAYLLELIAFYTMEFGIYYDVEWELKKYSGQYKKVSMIFSKAGFRALCPVQDVFWAWMGDDEVTKRLIMKYILKAPK